MFRTKKLFEKLCVELKQDFENLCVEPHSYFEKLFLENINICQYANDQKKLNDSFSKYT